MSERGRILRRIRVATERRVPHPGVYSAPAMIGGWERFAELLQRVGGVPHGPVPPDELRDYTEAFAADWAGDGRIVADAQSLERLGPGPWGGSPLDADPHELRDVAVAVVHGCIGVAENGAVGVGGARSPWALAFLAERLILLLDVAAIVPDMHRAIDALPPAAIEAPHFTWISGPSKTADIEMTLVMGAHGPRALGVIGIASATRDGGS